MPRTCSVCAHNQRAEIDRALIAGGSFRNIAEQFGTSATALFRHKAEHLPATLVAAQQAQEAAHGDDLLQQVRDLQQRTYGILASAEASGDGRTALLAVRECRGLLELLARILSSMQAGAASIDGPLRREVQRVADELGMSVDEVLAEAGLA
ncbi:MAG TPA: hypothetical protein VIR57_05785 [Chloroflexota bacterium]